MSATTVNPLAQKSYITQAASKWGVPYGILSGVYGMETAFGSNIATSSSGAVGAFQFLPSTAQSYNYPLTNSPTPQQFQQQADSAAHYLSDLHKRYGDWNTALEHYSGGGYGLSQVNAKAQSLQTGSGAYQGGVSPAAAMLGGSVVGLGAVAGLGAGAGDLAAAEVAGASDAGTVGATAAGTTAGGIASKLSNLSNLSKIKSGLGAAALITALLDPKHLLRIGMVIGGAAIIILALVYMLKSQQLKAG